MPRSRKAQPAPALYSVHPAVAMIQSGAAKKDRITHRFALASPADIDDEVRHWLRVAYDLDGWRRACRCPCYPTLANAPGQLNQPGAFP